MSSFKVQRLHLTVSQTARVDAQRVGHGGVGAGGGGAGAGASRRAAACALRGVRGIGRTPGIGKGLAVLRPRWLDAGLGAAAEGREGVVAKLPRNETTRGALGQTLSMTVISNIELFISILLFSISWKNEAFNKLFFIAFFI